MTVVRISKVEAPTAAPAPTLSALIQFNGIPYGGLVTVTGDFEKDDRLKDIVAQFAEWLSGDSVGVVGLQTGQTVETLNAETLAALGLMRIPKCHGCTASAGENPLVYCSALCARD